MQKSDIIKAYKAISHFMAEKLLKDAFDGLSKLIVETRNGDYKNRLEQLQTTYKFMLKYTVEGIEDPERHKIYNNLSSSTYRLLDEVKQNLLLEAPDNYLINTQRKEIAEIAKNPWQLYEDLNTYYSNKQLADLDEEHQVNTNDFTLWNNGERLFGYFFFNDFYSTQDKEVFQKILQNEYVPYYEKCIMLSAVTFSLMLCFDEQKFLLLFDALNHSDQELVQRALVGLLVNMYRYDNRLQLYPAIQSRLKLMAENRNFVQNTENIIKQLIQSKETEELTRKLQEEILPEVAKISPHLRNKMDLDKLMGENMQDDLNPDWQDMLDEVPGLTKKMEEFSNLQMEGADVFMSTFSQLKTFPFFGKLANWLYPFTVDHPDLYHISSDKSNKAFIDAINATHFLCNSDKYSFMFSIGQVPESYKNMMASAIEAEGDQIKEMQNDEALVAPDKKSASISNQYIQDLYRLFKLHPAKNELADIFKWKLDFFNKGFFRTLIEDKQVWKNIGAYYFMKGHYQSAAEIFEDLLDEVPQAELFQKTGYCYQKQGNHQKALSYYKKAEIIQSKNLWTLKKIAQCYRALKQPELALEYYRQAEQIQPDNLGMQLSIGNCYFELYQYDEALKRYYKIEYLEPENIRGWRPIAWVSYITGKHEQAEKYYQKILAAKPNAHDFINAGHLNWSMGNRKLALELYHKSITKGKLSIEAFLKIFEEDRFILLQQGVKKDDIPIMMDRLRYDLD